MRVVEKEQELIWLVFKEYDFTRSSTLHNSSRARVLPKKNTISPSWNTKVNKQEYDLSIEEIFTLEEYDLTKEEYYVILSMQEFFIIVQ